MSDVPVPAPARLAVDEWVAEAAERRRARRRGRWLRDGGWYLVLTALAVVTVFPFVWMLLTSIKGPGPASVSVTGATTP